MDSDDQVPGYMDIAEREQWEDLMDEVRTKVLNNLTRMEKAALFEDFDEFLYLYKAMKEEEYCDYE